MYSTIEKIQYVDSPFSILTKMTMTIMTNHSNFAVGRDCPLDMI